MVLMILFLAGVLSDGCGTDLHASPIKFLSIKLNGLAVDRKIQDQQQHYDICRVVGYVILHYELDAVGLFVEPLSLLSGLRKRP